MDRISQAINDFFDGKINADQLKHLAKKGGFVKHELIQSILLNQLHETNLAGLSSDQAKQTYLEKNLSKRNITIPNSADLTISAQKVQQCLISTLVSGSVKPSPVKHVLYESNPQGLANLGNTCFMNSVIQTINSNKQLCALIGQIQLAQKPGESAKDFEARNGILNSLTVILEQIKSEYPDQSIITDALKNLRNNNLITPSFPIKTQCDPNEFISKLFQFININQNPACSLQHVYISEVQDDVENESNPIISIRQPNILSTSISAKQLIETSLSDSNSQLIHEDLSKFTSISIAIPRFNELHRKSDLKVTNLFNPIAIKIFNRSDSVDHHVNLIPKSVICHLGDQATNGHYVTIEKVGDQYIEKSDSEIRFLTKEQAEETMQKNAYMINYEKS